MDNLKIQQLMECARGLTGCPYEDGMYLKNSNEGQKSFDCSSFVQYVFSKVGVELPRSSILQAAANGTEIKSLEDARPGDVLFFEGDRGHYRHDLFPDRKLYIGHLGIYLGDNKIIHAARLDGTQGGVVEHSLNPETTKFCNKNCIVYIKRFL